MVSGWQPDGQTPSRLHVITDASTGAVIGSFDEIETVAGTGNSIYSGTVTIDTTLSGSTYQMIDPSHGNGRTCDMNNGTSTCTTFTDADNVWGTGRQLQPAVRRASTRTSARRRRSTTSRTCTAATASSATARVCRSRVHYGNSYVNAFWDGAQMTYGDGSGNAEPAGLARRRRPRDEPRRHRERVPGGLTYSGESGGLNEATSDIFGTMVEFYANTTADPGDYQIGEKININGNGTPLRYMYNPSLDGSSDDLLVHQHQERGRALLLRRGQPLLLQPRRGHRRHRVRHQPGLRRRRRDRHRPGQGGEDLVPGAATYFVSSETYARLGGTRSTRPDLFGCGTEYRTVQAAWSAVNVRGTESC